MMKELGRIDVHGRTLRGREHDRNQDHFAIATLNKSMRVHQTNLSIDDESLVHGHNQGHLFLVADGISAAPAPARASGVAVDSVVQYFLNEMPWYHLADGEPADVSLALEDALRNSQEELQRKMPRAAQGTGTTMTMALVFWPELYLAHVGDCRCYLHRKRSLTQLTTDHTLAQVRREAGVRVTEGSERVLWNAVGGIGEELQPEVRHATLEPGDALVLLTDGVNRAMPETELTSILERPLSAEEACRLVVGHPGPDDRTAIVVRFLPREQVNAESADGSSPSPLSAHRWPRVFEQSGRGPCDKLRRARPRPDHSAAAAC
jgi:protein phosphatase